jgi:hypothetical protein
LQADAGFAKEEGRKNSITPGIGWYWFSNINILIINNPSLEAFLLLLQIFEIKKETARSFETASFLCRISIYFNSANSAG